MKRRDSNQTNRIDKCNRRLFLTGRFSWRCSLFAVLLFTFFLSSCAAMVGPPSSASSITGEDLLEVIAQEAEKLEKPVPQLIPKDIQEIGSSQDLFFSYQESLYSFREDTFIQIENIELFRMYWQELTEAGALHSVFVQGDVKLEYDDQSPCTIKMNIQYDASGDIISKIQNGSQMVFSSTRTAELYHKAQDILKSVTTKDMTDIQKETAIHNYIVANTKYMEEGDISYLSTAESVLLDGAGQCQGYTEATALLLAMGGIESRVVSGYATSANGTEELHAWNQVRLDGIWYHLDTTWNDPIPDSKDYVSLTYFNRSDTFFSEDHKWSSFFMECPYDYPL